MCDGSLSRGAAVRSCTSMATTKQETRLSDEQLAQAMELARGADSVELKLTVPETEQRSSASRALEMDPLDAQIRQVFFFDTPDLALNRPASSSARRRVQGKGDDSVVKLRPVVPDELRRSSAAPPNFGVEVDAMPGGFVCSASMKGTSGTSDVREVVRREPAAAQAVLEGAAGVLRRARAGRARARRPDASSARSSCSS